jgi:hypothetical protein
MNKVLNKNTLRYTVLAVVLAGIVLAGIIILKKPGTFREETGRIMIFLLLQLSNSSDKDLPNSFGCNKEARSMPVFVHWRNFTTKDGLPSDKAYTVRIDGDRVLVGTHDGLAVFENEKWHTYTTKDGLAHNGVVSIACQRTDRRCLDWYTGWIEPLVSRQI